LSPAGDGRFLALAWVVVSDWDALVEAAVPATVPTLGLDEPHAASTRAATATAMTHAAGVVGLAEGT
jgi:hypothetical protein